MIDLGKPGRVENVILEIIDGRIVISSPPGLYFSALAHSPITTLTTIRDEDRPLRPPSDDID